MYESTPNLCRGVSLGSSLGKGSYGPCHRHFHPGQEQGFHIGHLLLHLVYCLVCLLQYYRVYDVVHCRYVCVGVVQGVMHTGIACLMPFGCYEFIDLTLYCLTSIRCSFSTYHNPDVGYFPFYGIPC